MPKRLKIKKKSVANRLYNYYQIKELHLLLDYEIIIKLKSYIK